MKYTPVSSRPHHRPLNRISHPARMKQWTGKAGAILNETYRKMLRDGDIVVGTANRQPPTES